MIDIKGRTAFITGGGNGIGLGIARSLARAGAKLALADIDTAALAQAKEELHEITQVETFQLDVRDRDAYKSTAEIVKRELGTVSLLFNNAGVAGGVSLKRLTYDLWDWYININLFGVINGVQTFLPKMIEGGQGGHIVNTASGAGLVSTREGGILYTTSKFGVVGMSEALKLELESFGIGVSVLCPGPVATKIAERSLNASPKTGKPMSEEEEKRMKEVIAMVSQKLQEGVNINDVGDMVLKAVKENSLYIHTDRSVEELIKARTKSILESMPD